MSSVQPTSRRGLTWIQYLVRLIIIGTIILSVVGIIGYSIDLYRHGQNKHYIGFFSSAGFVILSILISVRLIIEHLTHWNMPHIQKYVVRIIWMIPIYATESWLALRFKAFAIILETLRECYEAYVLFNFMYYIIALLGEEQHLVQRLKEKSPAYGRHSWPVSACISPWIMGQEMLQNCKGGVFQYVIIKNLFAFLVCILEPLGYYNEGNFSIGGLYLYQCIISNISQIWALYCLILFYFATKEELSPYRPVGKFLCVKTIVFFTWYQSNMISILASPSFNIIQDLEPEDTWTVSEISKGLQDYLICIEMFFASIAFTYSFTYRDYLTAKGKDEVVFSEEAKPFLSTEALSAFLQSSVPDDILQDFRQFSRMARAPFFYRKESEDREIIIDKNDHDDQDDNNNNDGDDDMEAGSQLLSDDIDAIPSVELVRRSSATSGSDGMSGSAVSESPKFDGSGRGKELSSTDLHSASGRDGGVVNKGADPVAGGGGRKSLSPLSSLHGAHSSSHSSLHAVKLPHEPAFLIPALSPRDASVGDGSGSPHESQKNELHIN